MKVGIVGLGYVGLPLATAFAKKYKVMGFDINKNRVNQLNSGNDYTNELTKDQILESLGKSINFSYEENDLEDVDFFIISVPTPINKDKTPNLNPLKSASKTVAAYLKKSSIVVFESTVYPGVTEEICVPILEKGSGLKFNVDFHVGYSPERINPGDKEHTITKIKKVVSGSSPQALKKISEVYGSVITAGIYEAESIKVAEAAKVIENTQRDINIAFVNELSVIFEKMGIDTNQVLKAAGTKWNFLNFFPGLVGGHCIGVDPYYLAHKSQELGYRPDIILSGRKLNDNMPYHIVSLITKKLSSKNNLHTSKTAIILGATFKENCPDHRNSKVLDIYNELKDYNFKIKIFDPIANYEDLKATYDTSAIEILNFKEKSDVVIIAVAHQEFYNINPDNLAYKHSVIFDIKGMYENKNYMRL